MIKKHICKKLYFKNEQTRSYSTFSSDTAEAQLVSFFLNDSYNGQSLREWLVNERWGGLEKNMISLEKRDHSIVFSNNYDEREPKFEFVVSRATFSKILDEWEQARSESKEYIVIEVSDDNGVHIYATDKVETN